MEPEQPKLKEMDVDQQESQAENIWALVLDVLSNGDLLDDILLRLDSPTFLILACITNKFCTSRRLHPKFLPCFRDCLTLWP